VGRLFLLCLVGACGRIGFDATASSDGSGTGSNYDGLPGPDASHDAATSDGASPPAIAFVGSPIQHTGPKAAVDTVTFQATKAGDAVLILVACASAQQPTAVNLSATNWAFTPLSPLTINTAGQVYAASFGALAPDTAPVTLTINWTSSNCNRGQSALGDEFTNIDPTGTTTTFDAHAEAAGAGNCTTSITTGHANDTVWAGCYAATALTGVGAGYTKSAADMVGDYAEYKLTTDPMGTMEAVSFSNPNGYVISAVTIKPL
jgi:hypothetical protein